MPLKMVLEVNQVWREAPQSMLVLPISALRVLAIYESLHDPDSRAKLTLQAQVAA
jgi:hypothetical protein